MDDTVFERIAKIISDVMEVDRDEVKPETTADDVVTWDSLNHLRLITAVEEDFGIRFSMSEVNEFKDAGELAEGVKRLQRAS